jgi:hypothetical protein
MTGIEISRIKQPVCPTDSEARNSTADEKAFTW